MPMIWEKPYRVVNISKYYRSDEKVPLKCSFQDKYDNKVSMVEFGRIIRFYFIYYPDRFEVSDVETLLKDKLLLNTSQIDMFIYNQPSKIDRYKEIIPKGVWSRKSIFVKQKLEKLQRENIGKWFGADNPWIYEVPDEHSCMPGPVDDFVNVLLYIAYFGAVIDHLV